MFFGLARNLLSSCLCFLIAGIAGVSSHVTFLHWHLAIIQGYRASRRGKEHRGQHGRQPLGMTVTSWPQVLGGEGGGGLVMFRL